MASDEGAELLEFALLVPILCMFLFGIIVLGRAWNVRETMDRAAREGARVVVLEPCALCPRSDITSDWLKRNVVSPVLASDNIDVSKVRDFRAEYAWLDPQMDRDGNIIGTVCGVKVSFTYPQPLMIPFLPERAMALDLSAAVTMRLENQMGMPGCRGDL